VRPNGAARSHSSSAPAQAPTTTNEIPPIPPGALDEGSQGNQWINAWHRVIVGPGSECCVTQKAGRNATAPSSAPTPAAARLIEEP
jgi:hypothetical protein